MHGWEATLTRRGRVLGHISPVPETKRAVWPCMLQEEMLLREMAAETDWQVPELSHRAGRRELRGTYGLQCSSDPEWGGF